APAANAADLRGDRVEQLGDVGGPGRADIARVERVFGWDVAGHRTARPLALDNDVLFIAKLIARLRGRRRRRCSGSGLRLPLLRQAALALLLLSCTAAAQAQIVPALNSKPEPTAKVDTIPAPRDIAYPGTIQLTVDASDVTRGIFNVRQHVPVPGPGDFVLLYP